MLIDLDASASIGLQYSWSKHSSAYMPPEAIRFSLSVICSDLAVGNVLPNAPYLSKVAFRLTFRVVLLSPFQFPPSSLLPCTVSHLTMLI
jgi:hypothetical protein